MRFLFFAVILLVSCSKIKHHPNYNLSGSQTGYSFEEFDEMGEHKYSLELELTSNYDTLPMIYYMTCSWGSHTGVSNYRNLTLGFHPCDANFLMGRKIGIADTLKLETVVRKSEKKDQYNVRAFRIGYVLIDSTDISWLDFLELRGKQKKDTLQFFASQAHRIVWSNPIDLTYIDTSLNDRGQAYFKSSNQN